MRSRLVTETCSRPTFMVKSPLGRSSFRNSSTFTTVPLFCFVRFTASFCMLDLHHANYDYWSNSVCTHHSYCNGNLYSRCQPEQIHGPCESQRPALVQRSQ